MGMFVMSMFWFTPTLLRPKRSEVTETAAAKTNPELNPISAVATCSSAVLDEYARMKKAKGVGSSEMVNQPVLVR